MSHPPLPLPLASLLSPLVVRLLIFVQSGWGLSGLSSCARSGRRRRVHREKLDLLAWSQILLGTHPPLTPNRIGIGRSSAIARSNGKLAGGGIYLKVTRYLEGKKVSGTDDGIQQRCFSAPLHHKVAAGANAPRILQESRPSEGSATATA